MHCIGNTDIMTGDVGFIEKGERGVLKAGEWSSI